MDANSLKDLYDENNPSGDFIQYVSTYTGIDVARLKYIREDNLIIVDPPEDIADRSSGWTMRSELIYAMILDLETAE